MKKIGIYSGSFNPIHIGHLALANWICEYADIDEVWFLVSPQNPFKRFQNLMEDRLRFQMVQAAINGFPKFKASDFEFQLPKPSYTINTLQALEKSYPGNEFHLIIGADNWIKFPMWKDAEKIIAKHPILIYPRKGFPVTIPENVNAHLVEAPEIEISSTFIREALQEGKDIRFFLPENVREFFFTKKN